MVVVVALVVVERKRQRDRTRKKKKEGKREREREGRKERRNDIYRERLKNVSEALFYTGCDAPFQGPSLGRPILGASSHGYLGLFANLCGFLIAGVRTTQKTL